MDNTLIASSLNAHPLPHKLINLTSSAYLCKPSSVIFLKNQRTHKKIKTSQTTKMATVTSGTVAIPSFTGLRANASAAKPKTVTVSTAAVRTPKLTVKASMRNIGVAAVAAAASLALAGNAMAIEILLGGDDGSLVFVPKEFTVAKGEKIVFKNNAGFPHNVVFDEDEIPSGVDASKISMDEQELLNGPGETYEVALTEPGTYGFYCVPHQGAGMVGKVTVN